LSKHFIGYLTQTFRVAPQSAAREKTQPIRSRSDNRTFTELLGNDSLLLEGDLLQLQQDDEAWVKLSGEWSFRFVGNLAREGGDSFDTTELLTVSM